MDARTLQEVMIGNADYESLLSGMNQAMIAADITTINRAAMWCAQLGHESVGLKYMQEIADGSAYEGRADLGNVHPGDGRKYKGRGPIQLTGRNNYRAFTRWVQNNGLSTIDFEATPERLSEPKYGFLAASYYWTVARPQINSLCDRGDLEAVTRAINGGLNGLDDRRQRYQRALGFGNRLLPEGGNPKVSTEKVLLYSRDQVTQDTFYNCGPASAQTVINAVDGRFVDEAELGAQMGTTRNGTDYIGQVANVLKKYVPAGRYQVREMPNDPPTSEQMEQLWVDITGSIDAGFGVVANIVAPPSNYPRAVEPSTISPTYSGGTVYHYIAVMGYSDNGGLRKYWIADSGFTPYGYWVSHNQLASLIPPKGYTYSTASPKEGFLMALSDQEQKELLEKTRRIHHELTHEFQSQYVDPDGKQSTWRGTLVGFALQLDRKIEDMHSNMLPTIWKKLTDSITPKEGKK